MGDEKFDFVLKEREWALLLPRPLGSTDDDDDDDDDDDEDGDVTDDNDGDETDVETGEGAEEETIGWQRRVSLSGGDCSKVSSSRLSVAASLVSLLLISGVSLSLARLGAGPTDAVSSRVLSLLCS